MKCVKCNRKATYDAPEHLCSRHWASWWVEGYPNEKRAAKAVLRGRKQMTQREVLEWIAEAADEMLRNPRSKRARAELFVALSSAGKRERLKRMLLRARAAKCT